MGDKMTDEYEDRSLGYWALGEPNEEDKRLMDYRAQWQLIYTALWQSGAFATQEDAKRKTDEIIANRPSLGETLAAPMVITEKEDNG